MKTQEEIEQLANEYAKQFDYAEDSSPFLDYIEGYTQCQEDNDWTKNCECESSIGQTWCCNQCGLPYDTRKSYKKYTEEDMRQIFEFGLINQFKSFEVNNDNFNYFINLTNKKY